MLSSRIQKLFIVICVYAALLAAKETADYFFPLSPLLSGAVNCFSFALFSCIVFAMFKSYMRLNALTGAFIILFAMLQIWFLFDFTEHLQSLSAVPVFGADSAMRRVIENHLSIGIFLFFMVSVYFSFEKLSQSRDRLQKEQEKLLEIENAFQKETQFNRLVIENAAEGLCVCREVEAPPSIQFSIWNRRMIEITGFTKEEMNSMGWFETMFPKKQARDNAKKRMEALHQGNNLHLEEWSITRKDGDSRTIVISTAIFDDENGKPQILALISDITERKNLEQQLLQSQKMEAIGQLAGGIAHDFNNIMMVVLGQASLMRHKPEVGESIKRDIEQIIKAGERAASLTQKLLAFSRKQILEPKMINLNHVVSGLSEILDRVIGEDIEFHQALDENLGMIKADSTQIEQVIINLVVNACDAMPGGGTMCIQTRNLKTESSIRCIDEELVYGDYVELLVQDNGYGIEPEHQKKVFEPFYSSKEIGKGTGLGLSTVYGIIKQSGGHICLNSTPGKGSEFSLLFPRQYMSPSAPAKAAPTSLTPLKGTGTILLAEDNKDLRSMLTNALRQAGFQVLAASCGESAVQLTREYTEGIDLLLLDVVMPRLSGPETAHQIKAARPGVKTVYMTGYADEKKIQSANLNGDDLLLQKPITPSVLIKKIREVLESA